MSESLNVIALISGGKDSLYNLLHCLENGHRIVALANLYPPPQAASKGGISQNASSGQQPEGAEGEDEDLNSFMYQTVGYSIIPLYAACLGLPLYRREIRGSAVQTGRYYDASNLGMATASPDETEDLVPLLQSILRDHPNANALCSGAILSTYQRTRVESIAVRLGLTPLAYLWQYPALPPPIGRDDTLTGLLDDMAAAGCDARIIKIASGGIRKSLLWTNVADPMTRSRLVSGLRPFFPDHEFWLRGAVLGEGGEYETLAVNGPKRLWKMRIAVSEDKSSTVDGDGGVSYIRLAGATAVPNEPEATGADEDSLRVPRALDPQFEAVSTMIQNLEGPSSAPEAGKEKNGKDQGWTPFAPAVLQLVHHLTSTCVAISNITALPSADAEVTVSPTDQMSQICNNLQSLLEAIPGSYGQSWRPTSSNIVFTTLVLRDISNFGPVNSVYSTLFRSGEPNPPARVTLACNLPKGVEVSLSVILDLRPCQVRRGLHVQSRSYWAPANIGPYSQAICVPLDDQHGPNVNVHDAGLVEMVHLAGQIPLMPQSMKLSDGSFLEQAVLSLQHLWRVAQERGVDVWPWGVAFLKQGKDVSAKANIASEVWQQANQIGTRPSRNLSGDDDDDDDSENEDGPDAWDKHYNRFSRHEVEMVAGEHLHVLPKPNVLEDMSSGLRFVPSFITAEVVSLPRDATIEWWSQGLAHLPQLPGSVPRVSTSTRHYTWGSICRVSIHPSRHERRQEQALFNVTNTSIHLVTVLVHLPRSSAKDNAVDAENLKHDLTELLSSKPDNAASSLPLESIHGTAFVSSKHQSQWSKMQKQALFANLAVIPCKSVYGRSGFTASEGAFCTTHDEIGSSHDLPSTMQHDSTAREASSSMSTAVKPAAAQSCQPLAVALTIRIDNHASESNNGGEKS